MGATQVRLQLVSRNGRRVRRNSSGITIVLRVPRLSHQAWEKFGRTKAYRQITIHLDRIVCKLEGLFPSEKKRKSRPRKIAAFRSTRS